MKHPDLKQLGAEWARQSAAWRDPMQVQALWQPAGEVDPRLLQFRVEGAWWEALAASSATLLVAREYEHLLLGLSVVDGQPHVTYLAMPHPSGIAWDAAAQELHVASTRNPNAIVTLRPCVGLLPRLDSEAAEIERRPLLVDQVRFLPGSAYLHDLAMVGGELHANSVGQNAVIQIPRTGPVQRVWWPRCIEGTEGPVFGQNHIQLNSIAAGPSLAQSYFSASSTKISSRRPGHRNYAVDGRGVIFDGATREVYARGLTRPHSARLHGDRVWVDNSGYGEVGFVEQGRFEAQFRLPGWTRGLAFVGNTVFVATSRVIPRFSMYAPGLDVEAARCGLHALDLQSGHVLGSLYWPHGNQVFAVEPIPRSASRGLVTVLGDRRATEMERHLYYQYQVSQPTE